MTAVVSFGSVRDLTLLWREPVVLLELKYFLISTHSLDLFTNSLDIGGGKIYTGKSVPMQVQVQVHGYVTMSCTSVALHM